MNVFEQAKLSIDSFTIKYFLDISNCKQSGDELFVYNPMRADKHVGSFCINLKTGIWIDNANGSGGDLIDLVSIKNNLTKKEAAELILNLAGKNHVKENIPEKKEKPASKTPIPSNLEPKLQNYVSAEWAVKLWGKYTAIYHYKNIDNEWIFSCARYESENSKEIIPFYYTVENKFKAGLPKIDKLPLYGSQDVNFGLKFLIVEGEKCADIEVSGYVVLTWCGGTNKTKLSDWSILQNRDITIWPDNDDVGIKSANNIKKYLPQAKILKIENKREKWDIVNAHEEGINIPEFIKSCEYLSGLPFQFLGFDRHNYYIMPKNKNITIAIKMGDSTMKNMLMEIAPKNFWFEKFGTTDEDGVKKIDLQRAFEWFREKNDKKGMFNSEDILGIGAYYDNEDIVINTGRDIINRRTGKIDYCNYVGEKTYCRSKLHLKIIDKPWDAEDGLNFLKQLKTFNFEREIDYVSIIGYAALSSFASILKQRPHVWITGKRGIGKSTLLLDLLRPVLGNLCF